MGRHFILNWTVPLLIAHGSAAKFSECKLNQTALGNRPGSLFSGIVLLRIIQCKAAQLSSLLCDTIFRASLLLSALSFYLHVNTEQRCDEENNVATCSPWNPCSRQCILYIGYYWQIKNILYSKCFVVCVYNVSTLKKKTPIKCREFILFISLRTRSYTWQTRLQVTVSGRLQVNRSRADVLQTKQVSSCCSGSSPASGLEESALW